MGGCTARRLGQRGCKLRLATLKENHDMGTQQQIASTSDSSTDRCAKGIRAESSRHHPKPLPMQPSP